jgi:hypothetical protein
MLRNLPPNFTLSAGFSTKNYWAVSLNDVADLKLTPAEGYEGTFTVEVLLVKGAGTDPERRTARVAIHSNRSSPTVAATDDSVRERTANRAEAPVAPLPSGDTSPQGGARKAAPPQHSQDLSPLEQAMMDRGDTYWKQGDIAAARLLYRPLAKKNIAIAALAMARTFDPEALSALAVRGLRPDVAQAKSWYRMAKDLGSAQAAQRLATLDGQGN